MTNRLLLSACVGALLLVANPATAQDGDATEQRLELARQFVDLFVLEDLIDQMVPTITADLERRVSQSPDVDAEQARFFAMRFAELIGERMRADIGPMTAELMVDNFSSAEIEAMLVFYSTPEGSAIRKKMPAYMIQVLQTVIPYAERITPEIIDQVAGEMGAGSK